MKEAKYNAEYGADETLNLVSHLDLSHWFSEGKWCSRGNSDETIHAVIAMKPHVEETQDSENMGVKIKRNLSKDVT